MAAKCGAAFMTIIRSLPTMLLRLAGMLVYYLGLASVVIRLRRAVPRVLAYHACEPTESPFTRGLECNTPPALLAKHLDFLSTHYRLVPLASIGSGSTDCALAITFDDAYRSVYQYAFPILRRYQCAATVFVATDAIDNDSLIWVNELAWLLNMGRASARQAAAKILGVKRSSSIGLILDRARELCASNRCRDLLDAVSRASGVHTPAGSSELYLSWPEAAEMSQVGITFGNHTATHPDLAALGVASQREEIIRASRSLECHLPAEARLSALAYPFGSRGVETRDAAASCGIGVTVAIGGATEFRAPIELGRTPVGRASVARLFADLEIVEPAKASLRRISTRLARISLIRRGRWHSPRARRRVPGAPQV
jgi:peptidoglycan/xylan/chitin deacetylase (PgdA/CDA1 family)